MEPMGTNYIKNITFVVHIIYLYPTIKKTHTKTLPGALCQSLNPKPYIYTHTYIYIYIYIHTYIHTCIHTYIYIYICALNPYVSP